MQDPYGDQHHAHHPIAGTPPSRSNAAGIVGFILSLLSPCTCGVLAPIALICSLIGLRKEPRGLAIAGTVVSLFFSLGCGGIWLLGGISVAQEMKAIGWDAEFYFESDAISTAAAVHTNETGSPPTTLAEMGVVGDKATDSNGIPYVLRPTPNGIGIMVHGAGADMTFNTPDDVNYVNPDASDYMGMDEQYHMGSAELPTERIPEGY